MATCVRRTCAGSEACGDAVEQYLWLVGAEWEVLTLEDRGDTDQLNNCVVVYIHVS